MAAVSRIDEDGSWPHGVMGQILSDPPCSLLRFLFHHHPIRQTTTRASARRGGTAAARRKAGNNAARPAPRQGPPRLDFNPGDPRSTRLPVRPERSGARHDTPTP